METIILQTAPALLRELMEQYQDRERFLGYCKHCKNFEKRWSCPPLNFDLDEYLAPYPWACLIGAKAVFDDETVESTPPEQVGPLTGAVLGPLKEAMTVCLLRLERETPGSLAVATGSCDLCPVCARAEGKPCRRPGDLRYALDTMGLDMTQISDRLLNTPLLWGGKKLPKYYHLVGALLTKDPPDVSAIRKKMEELVLPEYERRKATASRKASCIGC